MITIRVRSPWSGSAVKTTPAQCAGTMCCRTTAIRGMASVSPTCCRYATARSDHHEAQQARAASRMAELERQVFEGLCAEIAACAPQLVATARAVAATDTLASFAQVADEQRYVRPKIIDEPVSEIVGGRHPVVEQMVGDLDRMTPPSSALAIKNELPDGRLVVMERAGHMAPMERHEQFNELLREFLAEVFSDRSVEGAR